MTTPPSVTRPRAPGSSSSTCRPALVAADRLRRRGLPTKKAAQVALDQIRLDESNGPPRRPLQADGRRVPLDGSLVADHRDRVRPTTLDSYRRIVQAHIVPRLGGLKLQRLDRVAVGRWVTDLTSTGLAPKTVRNAHAVLSKALDDAMELELVARNAAAPDEGPTGPSPHRRRRGPPTSSDASSRRPPTMAGHLVACARGDGVPTWRSSRVAVGRRRPGGRDDDDHEPAHAGGWQGRRGFAEDAGRGRTVTLDPATVAALTGLAEDAGGGSVADGWWRADADLVFTHADGRGFWPQMVTSRFGSSATSSACRGSASTGCGTPRATLLIAAGRILG